MKTLRILIALCIILGFATNNAISQKIEGTQECYKSFSPGQMTCLTEVVSGFVTEYQSFTNATYHVQARDLIYGETSKEEYEISYEYNSCGQDFGPSPFYHPNGSVFYFLTMLLKHDGELVAEIHIVGQYVINGQGMYVTDRGTFDVNCK
jgi:hypothetical protein